MTHTPEDILSIAKAIFDKYDPEETGCLDEDGARKFFKAWLNFVNPQIMFQEWFFKYRFNQLKTTPSGTVHFSEFNDFIVAKARGAKLLQNI